MHDSGTVHSRAKNRNQKTMKKEIKVTIWDDADEAIEVVGVYHSEMRGKRDRFGVPLEPDDEAEFEILDAVDQHGTTRNLSKSESRAAIEALWENFQS
jgi:hypothetical protein